MEANNPQGVDNLDSRAWFMKGTTRHYYKLYTIYIYAVALMVIDEKIKSFSNYMSMRAIDPQTHGHFAPKRQNLKDLCRGPLDIATYNLY